MVHRFLHDIAIHDAPRRYTGRSFGGISSSVVQKLASHRGQPERGRVAAERGLKGSSTRGGTAVAFSPLTMIALSSLCTLRNKMSPPTEPVVFVVGEHESARQWSGLVQARGAVARAFRSVIDFRDDDDAPGCVLLVLTSERETDGLQACARWMGRGDQRPLIVLATSPELARLLRRLTGGRVDVFEARDPAEEILARVVSASQEDVERRRLRTVWRAIGERFQTLTTKDHEVLELLLLGLPNKAIAQRAAVTERAIEMRRAAVMKKLHARSHAELIRLVTQYEVVTRFGITLPVG